TGMLSTVFGWRLEAGPDVNSRMLRNFPKKEHILEKQINLENLERIFNDEIESRQEDQISLGNTIGHDRALKDDHVLNLETLRLTPERLRMIEAAQETKAGPPSRRGPGRARVPADAGLFVLGPLPLRWFDGVLRQHPGSAKMYMALLLWYVAGLQRTRRDFQGDRAAMRVNLSQLAAVCHLNRRFLTRGLRWLERRGLVTVDRKPGQKLVVRIVTEAKPRA